MSAGKPSTNQAAAALR